MANWLTAILTRNIPSIIICTCVLIAFLLCKKIDYKHERYVYKFIFVIILLSIIGIIYSMSMIDENYLFLTSLLCLLFFIESAYTGKNIIFPESLIINRLKKITYKCGYNIIENNFNKKPILIRSVISEIKWRSMFVNALISQDKFRESYEECVKISKLPLFDNEKEKLLLKRAEILLLLGDTSNAQNVLEQISIDSKIFNSAGFLFVKSQILENRGEFESARQRLLSAIGDETISNSIEIAAIYNNLGRMEGILENTTNAIHYYRKAVELSSRKNNYYYIHITYPNIIDSYLLANDHDNAALFFQKYSELIDKNNVDDLLKFNNYSLEYYRQTANLSLYIDTIVRGRIDILPRLTSQECYVFEASELRIRWNSQIGWKEKIFWFKNHLPAYLNLKFPTRYLLTKEMFNILLDLSRKNDLGLFGSVYYQLLQFMHESKNDIDQYIFNLPDYCVSERCFWEKEQAFLRTIKNANELHKSFQEYCEEIFTHLRNIKKIQLLHGNPLQAIEADLNIADECMGLANAITGEVDLIYLKRSLQKHVNQAHSDLAHFRNHPVAKEYALRIARYALFAGDEEKAKKHFYDFTCSGVSIRHYSKWLQDYHHTLKEALMLSTN